MIEPTKVCAKCKARKPWSEFWAKAKWEDGTMRQPHARCKDCWRERTRKRARDRRQRDPDTVRAADRERYRRNRRDPDWAARRRVITRRAKRKQMDIPPERWRVLEVDVERMTWLPIGPFREWLGAECDRRGTVVVAEILGVQERQVWRWLHESEQVDVDRADAAFVAVGEPYLLIELYPELYEEAAA